MSKQTEKTEVEKQKQVYADGGPLMEVSGSHEDSAHRRHQRQPTVCSALGGTCLEDSLCCPCLHLMDSVGIITAFISIHNVLYQNI